VSAEASTGLLSSAVRRLRAATGELHRHVERTLDIIPRLSDPLSRPDMIRRYAAFHIPADAVLGAYLADVPDLEFRARSRAPLLAGFAGENALPAFPAPGCRAEALGMLYVLEGSTLGGRLILRALADGGIRDPALAFLDPYGAHTALRWRGFLSVLSRETGEDERPIRKACAGACSGFRHAERVLGGGMA
jgi:heme oxygenase